MSNILQILRPAFGLAIVSALAVMPVVSTASEALPPLMEVPAGNFVAWRAPATGFIKYECRRPFGHESIPAWGIASAEARLGDGGKPEEGTYRAHPESWHALDGSSFTGMEVVRAATGSDRLYDQLVMAGPSPVAGLLSGVTYVQRLVSAGGAAPGRPCQKSSLGERASVAFQAEFVFWKAN
ncbi:DUF3455 domain-containing protein [Achromobacter sp. Root565]|uniref:DUF3455 domain-containing protein n=1 Tax=Achromobacter sp. Root565 TaxID=1736564 RepID=UPI0009E98549